MKKRKICVALALLFAIFNESSLAQPGDLPWYLQSPKNDTTAAAIDAVDLIKSTNGDTVVVAVIDNGIWKDHPSLNGVLLPGWDMVSPERNPNKQRSANVTPDLPDSVCPVNGKPGDGLDPFHGTEIASIIGGNGKLGVTGVNPHVFILPIKAVGVCKASRRDLIDSIAWAAGLPVKNVPPNLHPARVINISMAGRDKTCHEELQAIVDKVVDKGVLIVSAAGNTFGRAATEPAVCRGVIGVGAINPDRTKAFYSAVDDRIVLLAPGGGRDFSGSEHEPKNRIRVATYKLVPSQDSKQDKPNMVPVGIETGIGTSYAAPLATGVVAGLISKHPQWTTRDVLALIESTLTPQSDSMSRFLNYRKLNR